MKINFNFTFRKYKIIKNYKDLNHKFLIVTGNISNKNQLINKENSFNSFLLQHKVTNKAFIQIIRTSIFKNFKNFINGPILFNKLKNKKIGSKKIKFLNKKNLSLFNLLILKLNNKLYSPKKILISNFLNYKANIILLVQVNIIGIKICLKN